MYRSMLPSSLRNVKDESRGANRVGKYGQFSSPFAHKSIAGKDKKNVSFGNVPEEHNYQCLLAAWIARTVLWKNYVYVRRM